MYLQNKASVFDIQWNEKLKYGEIYLQNEIEQSKYNFEVSDAKSLFTMFDLFQKEVDNCVNAKLVLPAYDYVLKCSHTFNLLDARGVISKDERINFITLSIVFVQWLPQLQNFMLNSARLWDFLC